MEKKYILSETEMRKIMLYLENTIPDREELAELGHYEIVAAVYSDLLEDIGDALGLDDSKYIEPETLEIVEW